MIYACFFVLPVCAFPQPFTLHTRKQAQRENFYFFWALAIESRAAAVEWEV